MEKGKYETLKELLKQWMLDNADMYDAFGKMMNEQSDEGFQQILLTAITLFPSYKKLIEKKIHSKDNEDITDHWCPVKIFKPGSTC